MQLDQESTANSVSRDNLDRLAAGENTQQFITFTLGSEEYGIDIMVVREIKGWTETTMIPNAPTHVRGVINLRGVIVPIFDLRARFGMGLTATTTMHVVIIVATGTRNAREISSVVTPQTVRSVSATRASIGSAG